MHPNVSELRSVVVRLEPSRSYRIGDAMTAISDQKVSSGISEIKVSIGTPSHIHLRVAKDLSPV